MGVLRPSCCFRSRRPSTFHTGKATAQCLVTIHWCQFGIVSSRLSVPVAMIDAPGAVFAPSVARQSTPSLRRFVHQPAPSTSTTSHTARYVSPGLQSWCKHQHSVCMPAICTPRAPVTRGRSRFCRFQLYISVCRPYKSAHAACPSQMKQHQHCFYFVRHRKEVGHLFTVSPH